MRIYSTSGWKFLFHRVSGLFLFAYFIAHILAISTALIFGDEVFNSIMGAFQEPAFKFVEIAVVLCVLGHGFNGLHMISVERGWIKSNK